VCLFTLVAGEDRSVDALLQVIVSLHTLLVCRAQALAEENHGTTGAYKVEKRYKNTFAHIFLGFSFLKNLVVSSQRFLSQNVILVQFVGHLPRSDLCVVVVTISA
jgi:hypothetical protein